jgi:hypothetical protein
LDWFVTKQRGICIRQIDWVAIVRREGNLRAYLSNTKYIINNAFAFDATYNTKNSLTSSEFFNILMKENYIRMMLLAPPERKNSSHS